MAPSSSPPIMKLPIEILMEIFSQCIPPFPQPTVDDAPLILGRVCSTWRQVLYNAPMLWNHLNIDLKRTTSSEVRHATMIHTWLERSKKLPFSFALHQHGPSTTPLQVVEELLHCRNRWTDIRIDASISTIHTLLSGRSDPPEALHGLQLKLLPSPTPVAFDLSSCSHSWDNLTTLMVGESNPSQLPMFPDLTEYFSLLGRCKNLQNCRISADLDFRFWEQEPIVMTKLQSLQLVLYEIGIDDGVDHTGRCLGQFITLLETPGLVDLSIKVVTSPTTRSTTSAVGPNLLSETLANKASTLRSLSLAYVPIAEMGLLGALGRASHLERLKLRSGIGDPGSDPITDEILNLVCRSPITATLEDIYLECTGLRVSEEGLKAISSAGLRNLRQFHIKSRMPASQVTSEVVDKLEARGVVASIEEIRLF